MKKDKKKVAQLLKEIQDLRTKLEFKEQEYANIVMNWNLKHMEDYNPLAENE